VDGILPRQRQCVAKNFFGYRVNRTLALPARPQPPVSADEAIWMLVDETALLYGRERDHRERLVSMKCRENARADAKVWVGQVRVLLPVQGQRKPPEICRSRHTFSRVCAVAGN
jgi:hypothetical protein